MTKLDILAFWANIGKMSLIPAGMTIVGMRGTSKNDLSSWGMLLAMILLYTAIYSAGMYFFVMNDYEKDVVRKPVFKVLGKMGIRKR